MSGMELTTNYPPSKFQADNDLTNTNVIGKYKHAADVVNSILPELVSRVSPGVSICDLCQYGDDLIEAMTLTEYKNAERGIAFPTCISVNNLIQHVSPLLDNDYLLKAGDVVKIELGAHMDGYIATAAHTTVVSLDLSQPITGPAADVICATYYACEAAIRMMKPGVKASEITRTISEIAAYFRCKPVENTYSSTIKRFVLRGGNDIENGFPEDMIVQDLEKYDFEIQANQGYQVNVILTTGDGKTKQSEYKPFVYQRDVNKSYQLKMKAARAAFNEINEKHTVFPFATRAMSNSQTRLGLASLLNHELVTSLPVLRSSLTSDKVAQFKSTVLVTPTEALRLTLSTKLPFVHSQYCIPEPTNAAQILHSGSINQVKASRGLPQLDVTFGERRIETEDTNMDMDME
ncbi:peptidase M24, structural domain-containing protein [Halteromyces radiatus]|uniref:peptidase M24, structural domain-containing protein n=1 Tax=Halteromyces radiatus TaxID=101107 RepID=UPI002221202D|nr:peptidase M24, structural domain-containing protein [Halteromyces radiatus]KAI8099981.1 peptidase M24, structural domain-containing protein [Halteromyces radiatus]